MKKNKIICAIIFLCIVTYPAEARKIRTFQPLNIAPLEIAQEQPELTENYPKINTLESNLFKRTFERENIYKRLARLENRLFKEAYPNLPLSTRVDNILNNVDAGIMYNISTKELAKLETKVLGRTYSNDDTESRITRLEKEMLGAMQGGNLTERFNTVKTASKHYNSYPEIANSQSVYQTYSGPYTTNNSWQNIKPRGLGGFMQNLLGAIFGGMTSGTMTGYTPPIYDPYNPYAQATPYSPMGAYPSFMNPGSRTQDYYMSNTRGYYDDRNLGSQSSVRILD